VLKKYNSAELLTIPRYSGITGICPKKVRDLVKKGEIPSVLVGTRRRIPASWLVDCVSQAQKSVEDTLGASSNA